MEKGSSRGSKTSPYALVYPDHVAVMYLIDGESLGDAVRKYCHVHPVPDSVHAITPAEIPATRVFRGAWVTNGGPIEHDMAKARTIHMDRIRMMRDVELEKLDRAYIIADETGSPQAKMAVAAQKQALRDLPAAFDLSAAKTVDELMNLWPSILPNVYDRVLKVAR